MTRKCSAPQPRKARRAHRQRRDLLQLHHPAVICVGDVHVPVGIHRHPVRAVRAGEGQVTCWLELVAPAVNSTTRLLPVNGAEGRG
jgi:hypothetical protein